MSAPATYPSAEMLGQIALIQSMVGNLPDKENMLRFVCRGLAEVPGVETVDYRTGAAAAIDGIPKALRKFPIRTGAHAHGELLVHLSDPAAFSPYEPFIVNLGNMLAVIFEERRQRKLNTAILADLEQRVYERTRALEAEITERKKTQAALQAEKEKAERYLDIVEVILVALDARGHITLLNRKGYEVLGYEPGELVGRDWFKICLPPGDDERARADYNQILARGVKSFEYFESPVLTRHGDQRFIAWHNRLMHDDKGDIIGMLSAGEDITERRRAQEALRQSEANLRITLDSIGDGVISTDLDGNIIRINRVAETLTGWTQEEASGKKLATVFRTRDEHSGHPAENSVETVFNAGAPAAMPLFYTVLTARNGTEHRIAESAAPIRDAHGQEAGVVLVFRDVTEQLKIEQELLKVKKLESLGLLAGGIAHDFNNLLSGIFGNMEMAKMLLPDNHEACGFLESAGRSMDSAIHLTNQLLTFSKGGEPVTETLSIRDVIIDTAQFSIRGSRSRLQIEIAPDLWWVKADKGQLSQVISNLVINADQAMPAEGTITVRAENVALPEGRHVQITVRDEGEGIPSQVIDRIFDPFFTTKPKGSGLGLATTHSIVRKHKGWITVDSEPGCGTTFTIRLPAATGETEKAAEESSPETGTAAVPPTRVLVMDDEALVRSVIGAMLEHMGHEVTFAEEGREAVEKYRSAFKNSAPYDIVITDLTIPGGMGGREAARKILDMDPEAKIIVSSGYATDPVMADYAAYGFKAIAAKPFRFDQLGKVIRQVLAD